MQSGEPAVRHSHMYCKRCMCPSCDSEQSPLPRVVPQLVCSRMSNRWPRESLKSFDLVSGHAAAHVIRAVEITSLGTHEGQSVQHFSIRNAEWGTRGSPLASSGSRHHQRELKVMRGTLMILQRSSTLHPSDLRHPTGARVRYA